MVKKEFLEYITERLSLLKGVSFKAMMGEYIIYYQGKIVGGIYDDRLLVKPTRAAKSLMPDASFEIPYEGARAMLAVENVDDGEFLKELFIAVEKDLPTPKK